MRAAGAKQKAGHLAGRRKSRKEGVKGGGAEVAPGHEELAAGGGGGLVRISGVSGSNAFISGLRKLRLCSQSW